MFLANENFPVPSTNVLRAGGFQVLSIYETQPGISDEQILQMAREKDLIILTFDKDYGELIFRHSAENPPAVIYFRYKGINPFSAGEMLLKLLESNELQFRSAFTVIEHSSIRQRFYLPKIAK